MSTTYQRVAKRTPRSQVFTVVLLMLVYVTQPVLALAGSLCLDHECGTETDCCCDEAALTVSDRAPVEASCCASEDSDTQLPDSPTVEDRCSCQVDSAPSPTQEPLLPPRSSDAASDGSLAEWIRAQAELFAHTPCAQPWRCLAPGGENRAKGCGTAFAPGTAVGSLVHDVVSVGSWTLLRQGVSGFLAVLSVART